MNTAIIVAAGSGTRFASDTPKQFVLLKGRPIIVHTIERFERCTAVDHIVVVAADEHLQTISEMASDADFSKISALTGGGSSRTASVINGFSKVSVETEIVLVHDGVRPLVSSSDIEATIEKAKMVGAACLTAPVTDTIKIVDNNMIDGTIERRALRRALTPQAFRYEILKRALAEIDEGLEMTDECQLLERLGIEIAAVNGSSRNIKITEAADLIAAAAYLDAGIV